MRKFALGALGLLALLIAIVLFNTINFAPVRSDVAPVEHPVLDAAELTARLSQAIQIPTISSPDSSTFDYRPFARLRDLMKTNYPLTHTKLGLEIVAQASMLFTWPGSNNNLKPIVLLSHLDVVPADAVDAWTHAPFSGQLSDGFIWGRGTIDDKAGVFGLMEAVEYLLAQDFQPQRTIYLAFGHDEEVLGSGAVVLASTLEQRNIEAEFILDEGMAILNGILPGVEATTAMLGIAEKGYLTIDITAVSEGGHSSQPPEHTALGDIAQAIVNLENNQRPAAISGAVAEMFDAVGREMGFLNRLAFANTWLLEPIIISSMLKGGNGALVRTTTAATMANGSIKDNILPTVARASINFRLIPGETVEDIIDHVIKTIDNDQITVSPRPGYSNPSPVSDTSTPTYALLSQTVREIFPEVSVAPALVLGATDSRNYGNISPNIYRFAPLRIGPDDMHRFHGIDERISVTNYLELVSFYHRLIINAAG